MLSSSRRLLALDHFRTPYELSTSRASSRLEQLRCGDAGPLLLWPRTDLARADAVLAMLGEPSGSGLKIFARVVPDDVAERALAEWGGRWHRACGVFGTDGDRVGSLWRSDDGSVFLPFDPDEVCTNYRSERYNAITRRPGATDWRRLAVLTYYQSRRLLPRSTQIWLRRHYARLQARRQFPRWPLETGLHDFLDAIFSLVQSLAGEPVPRIAAWPGGKSWALVLTHDVETEVGLGALDRVLEIERSMGLRSAWYLVPRRYDISQDTVDALLADGFEVGVHGLYHDGRDLASMSLLRRRLPAMHEAAGRWRAVGFRAPATQRNWNLMAMLDFDYDTSYPDSDPFEPQSGGCCTWLPFFIGDVVELPMTMTQDHTLFTILRQSDERAWVEKAEKLRSHGGMVTLDTHPDYLIRDEILVAYRRFLESMLRFDDAWRALPREVSAWWRDRARLQLQRGADGWAVVGRRAQEARMEFVETNVGVLEMLGCGVKKGKASASGEAMGKAHEGEVN